jgi:hypothetical protein
MEKSELFDGVDLEDSWVRGWHFDGLCCENQLKA